MYLIFCRKYYLAELEKSFLRFRKFFAVPKTFSKIPRFYMHTNISRTAMIFETEISLHDVTKYKNPQTNNNPQWPNSKIINTSQLNYPLSF